LGNLTWLKFLVFKDPCNNRKETKDKEIQIFEYFHNLIFRYLVYLSPFPSSVDKMSKTGSKKVSLFAILRSNESNNDGNKIKFETIANKSVTETKPPNAMVPPKLDTVNTKNPKNNTIEV